MATFTVFPNIVTSSSSTRLKPPSRTPSDERQDMPRYTDHPPCVCRLSDVSSPYILVKNQIVSRTRCFHTCVILNKKVS